MYAAIDGGDAPWENLVELTLRLLATIDRLGAIADGLGARSYRIVDFKTSPRMHAVMLFRRLRTNLRGYMPMWRDGSYLNADILLRCIVEATICLAANAMLGAEFVKLLRTDAAATLKGAIKLWRGEGFGDLVRSGERHLRELFADEAEASRRTLNWKDLAERAGEPRLYSSHKMLSGQGPGMRRSRIVPTS